MNLQRISFFSILSHIFVIVMICSITIFSTYTWGRYVLVGCMAMIMLCDFLQQGANYKLCASSYFAFIIVFALYTAASALWAINSSAAIEKAQTLFEIILMIFVMYNHYSLKEESTKDILLDIKIACFAIVIYSLLFYGIEQLMLLASAEERLGNDFANVNTIAIMAAIGIIIELDSIIANKRLALMSLLCIPAMLLVAVTQSRKALIMVGMGLALILWQRSIYSKKNVAKSLLKLILYVLIGVVVIRSVLSLPVFSGVLERMELWINSVTGEGKVDSSTIVRNNLIEIGFEAFLQKPILGVGIGSSNELAKAYFNMDCYLHNNFVELLASGGILGFFVYYSMYIYLIAKFWRYKNDKNSEYIVCLTLMLVLLTMDYGRVSYYAKTQYIFLLAMFLETDALKNKLKNN